MRLLGDTIIGRSEGCENMELCGYELRFELWETEGIFKNKNFGRLSQRRYSPKYTNIGVQTQGRGIV